MKKEKIIKELFIIFWIFIIGSIIGYIYETVLVLFQKGYIESRRGLIYGPFIPVYGIGGIIYYLVLKNMDTKNKIKVVLVTMVLGGITEYMCSLIQEKVYGTISWDYSYLPFNFNGRTSLLHCTYWGIAGLLYCIIIKPKIEILKQEISKKNLQMVTVFLMCFMIFDISISCIAADRQTARRRNIMPQNKLERFLDKHYPDEFMDRVYANKKEIK